MKGEQTNDFASYIVLFVRHEIRRTDSDYLITNSLSISSTYIILIEKNFYASSPSLKRCVVSKDPRSTVTCAVLSTEGSTKASYANRYEKSVYIMPLRNPMTALPFAANHKQIAYHGQVGQMPSST